MYSKPRILAISKMGSSFAAGCPANQNTGSYQTCKNCERTA